MNKKLAPSVGTHWALVSRIETREVLITKVLEILDDKSEKFFWLCVDAAAQRRARLPVKSALPGGTAPPRFSPGMDEIIYRDSEGIAGFSLRTGEERLHIPVDFDRYDIGNLWLSAENPPRILYLLEERAETWTQTRARIAAGGEQGPTGRSTYRLHMRTIGSEESRLVAEFKAWPVSLDVDWDREIAFALVGQQRKKKLVKIDLKNGDAAVIRETDSASHLVISPRKILITWQGYQSPGIMEALPNGRYATLTKFGWYPAFSPDGRRFAFTVSDTEIWIQDAGSQSAEKIISFPESASQKFLDRITWCPCGDHFAVCLAGLKGESPDQHDTRLLVIVDSKKREILILEDLNSIGSSGERVWVPADAVKTVFN